MRRVAGTGGREGDGRAPFAQLKQHLRDEIRKGRLSERIPAERELARAHGVAYMTVRRAVGELVDEGLLVRRPGQGTFVCPPGRVEKRTRNLGFVLAPAITDGVGNAFYSKVFHGLERAARAHGHTIIYGAQASDLVPPPPRRGADAVPRKVDGIVAACLNDPAQVLALTRSVPVVLIDDAVEGVDIPCIRVDNVAASREATLHLVARGHRRIAYLGGSAASIVGRERISGYVQALVESGLPTTAALIHQDTFGFATGYAGAKALFATPEPPTGLFCANDVVAFGALKWLHENGRAVPGAVGVVGFDDLDAAAQVYPALSTVAVPKEAIGELAVRTLLRLIDSGATTLEQPRLSVPTRFIIRESS